MKILKLTLLVTVSFILLGVHAGESKNDFFRKLNISKCKIENYADIRITYLINMGYSGSYECACLKVNHPLDMNYLNPCSLVFLDRLSGILVYNERGEVVKVNSLKTPKAEIKYTTRVIAGKKYYVGMKITYPANKRNRARTKDLKIEWDMYNNVPNATALVINDSRNGKSSFRYAMEVCPATRRKQLCNVYTIRGRIVSKSFKVVKGDDINLYFYQVSGNSLALNLQKKFHKFGKEYKLMEVRSQNDGKTKYEYYSDPSTPAVYGKIKRIFLPNSKVKEYTYYSDGIIRSCGVF